MAVLSAGDVEDNNPNPVHGSYGVKNTVTGSNHINDSILIKDDFPLLNSFYFLPKYIEKYKNLTSQIEISELPNGTNLTQGIYSINSSTTELSGEVNLSTADTNEYFVFNISGDLLIDNSFKLNIGNVLPHKIIWNVEGEVIINDNSVFYGIILSNSKITLGKDVEGKIALLSNVNIKLGSSNCLYSISEMGKNKLGRISGGGTMSAFVCSDGRVQVWGSNLYGQLANGTYGGYISNPIIIPNLTNVVAVETGETHVLALKSDGTIWAWGNSEFGQLGNGSYFPKYIPVQVQGISNAISISIGFDNSYAVLADGTVMAWGYNLDGMLGVQSSVFGIKTPAIVQGVTNAISVTAGLQYTYALLKSGEVMAWGDNSRGLLGINGLQSTIIPHIIPQLKDVVQLSTATQDGGGTSGLIYYARGSGSGHTLALLKDGTVKSWGENKTGCLGNPTYSILFDENIYPTPNIVPGLTKDVVEVEAGVEISFVRFKDGSMKVWGHTGILGTGICNTNTWDHYDINPVDVVSVNDVVDISIDNLVYYNDFAVNNLILKNYQMKSWGNGEEGGLGNGSSISSCSPVNVNTTCSIIPNPYPNALAEPNFKTLNYHNSQSLSQAIVFVNETKYSTSAVTYLWNFGDGTTVTKNDNTNASHIYTNPGYYNVTLTAINHFSDNSTVSNSISIPVYIIPSTAGYNSSGCISSYTFDVVDLSSNVSNTLSNPQHVTSNFTISGTWTILKGTSVIVDNGVVVSFGPQAKVIVEPGAVLKLEGAKFTGVNTGTPCGTFMWMGVEVLGNNLTSNTAEQGKLTLTSSSTIEFAHNAVVLGHYVLKPISGGFEANYHDITKGGGIIDANGVTFNGNGSSIVFFEYGFQNMSIIRNCNFWSKRSGNDLAPLWDPNYLTNEHYLTLINHNPFFALEENGDFGFSSNYHILAYDVQRIKIFNNVFDNAVIAIKDYNTSYFLNDNDFTNIAIGIYAEDKGSAIPKRTITENTFNDFYDYGIRSFNTNYTNISKNYFNNLQSSGANSTFGISMINSKNYKINDNSLSRIQKAISLSSIENSISTVGYTNDGNIFFNCVLPLSVSGNSVGLKIKCNNFNNDFNYAGKNWFVTGDLSSQGYSQAYPTNLPQVKRPAGNIFDRGDVLVMKEIYSNKGFTYYTHADQFTIPVNFPSGKMNVNTNINSSFPVDADDACAPSISVTGNPNPYLDDLDALQRKIDTLGNSINDLVASIDNYGQTNSLLNIVLGNEELESYTQDLLDASPLSDEVLTELILKENAISTNYEVVKSVLLRNLPCADALWTLIQDKVDEFDPEDYLMFKNLQEHNPNHMLPAELSRYLNFTIQEKGELENDVLRLYEGVDNQVTSGYVDADLDYAAQKTIEIYNSTSTKTSNRVLVQYYLQLNNPDEALGVLNSIPIENDEDQYFYELQTIYINLKNENRSAWDLTENELDNVYNIAAICPVSPTVSYAKSLLRMIGKDTASTSICDSILLKPAKQSFLTPKSADGNKMKVMPVPAQNEITILYDLPVETNKAELIIYNVFGQETLRMKLDYKSSRKAITLSTFENGLYICRIETDGKEYDKIKFLIQR